MTWEHLTRVHVNTAELLGGRPAIAVVPAGETQPRPHSLGVTIRCLCGAVAASVRQSGTSAHVLVEDAARVEEE